MDLRPLGSTPHLVSPIGLGLAALGRPGYINVGHAADLSERSVAALERRAHALLDEAYAGGVRYFDAARSYGRAEAFLGSWLRRAAPQGVVVGSKWGYTYTADWRTDADTHEVKDHSAANLARQWPQTRAELGGFLNLYQIHSATLETGVLEDGAVLERLAALKADGIAVGLSVSGPEQAQTIRRALAVEVQGTRLFDTVQATWNPLEPAAGGALATARREGVGVIVKEALANGRLTRRNDEAALAPKLAVLTAHAERLGMGLETLALAAALAQPWVDTVLSGAATRAHLRDNLEATNVTLDDEAGGALSALAEPSPDYWRTRSKLPWQ